ncbi:MAG: HAD-IC family P-type ATPase [Thermodesulfobacteriota bacterium]
MDHKETDWHRIEPETVFERLQSSPQGLTKVESMQRLKRFGFNELRVAKPSALVRFLRQFHNPLVYILLAAATITAFLSILGKEMWADTIVIIGVVILNTILGFIQEGKAERALEALQSMIVTETKVLRDNMEHVVPSRDIVPGDIVVLDEGDRIPADMRIFTARNAYADESTLTGESVPVNKNSDAQDKDNIQLGDRKCMAFSGTFLTRGIVRGIVVATSEQTEFGKIAALVKTTDMVETPLQKKIREFTRTLVLAIVGIGSVNFLLGNIFGYEPVYSFLASVSLIVAAIPEMLPMIITATLALSASVMAANKALTRRLPAAETLGSTTVICSDKTGTLTKNEMTVQKVYSGGKIYNVVGIGYEPKGHYMLEGSRIEYQDMSYSLRETLLAGYLCNSSKLVEKNGFYHIIGDPTEGALIVSAMKGGKLATLKLLDEIPFNSESMFMATLHEDIEENIIFVKGSPEKIISLCNSQLYDDRCGPLQREEIIRAAEEMAGNALRVLGMAHKIVPKDKTTLSAEDIQDLTFLGLKGMIDPPRPEVIEAVAMCKQAGIRPVMITGDHGMTALAIARKLGIVPEDHSCLLTGEQIDELTDDDLYELVESVSVFARVAPEHKLRIARQFQKRGHIVAMTGDGVNDAPALKAADIGVAMGITGTEVSKEASDMILTDDNFATIVKAVEEGRHTWNNLERAILYTLPTNAGQAFLVMGAVLMAPLIPIFAARLPLEPVQILWVNLLDSVFLTMPLIMEKKTLGLLSGPPREHGKKIVDALFIQRVIIMGTIIAACGFVIYYYFGNAAVSGIEIINPLLLTQAQTAAFWAVLMAHFGFVFSARAVHKSAFTFSPFTNKWLWLGVMVSLTTRLVPTFFPAANALFKTAPFPMKWWPYILICLLPGFIGLEIDKFIRRKKS